MTRPAAILVAALVAVIGCGTPPPSETPVTPSIPIGCFGVPLDPCQAIGQAAAASIRTEGLAPVYVWVQLSGCAVEPCADRFGVGSRALAVVELGRLEPRQIAAEMGPSGLAIAAAADQFGYVEVQSRSRPAAGPGPFSLSLGHCGIASGIDFDGSFWDAVGSVDYGASEAINSADGIISLTSPTTATFSTPSGFRLKLVRHQGTKFLPLCA